VTAIESLAVAALCRWSYNRAKLHRGEPSEPSRHGYTPRQSRTADARHVRVIDFEPAFATVPPDARLPLVFIYRDQIPTRHAAAILGCSPQVAVFHADEALSRLTDALDRRDLLSPPLPSS
jgi:DNA-directed RNA polymerase specialized sigma24 family protein